MTENTETTETDESDDEGVTITRRDALAGAGRAGYGRGRGARDRAECLGESDGATRLVG
jgi:hypothetical protein